MGAPGREPRLARRLAWFVGLWLAGVASLALVGWIIRTWLGL